MICIDCRKNLGDVHGRTRRCGECSVKSRRKNQREIRLGLRKPKARHEQGAITRWEKRYKMFLQWWERPMYSPNEMKTSPTK